MQAVVRAVSARHTQCYECCHVNVCKRHLYLAMHPGAISEAAIAAASTAAAAAALAASPSPSPLPTANAPPRHVLPHQYSSMKAKRFGGAAAATGREMQVACRDHLQLLQLQQLPIVYQPPAPMLGALRAVLFHHTGWYTEQYLPTSPALKEAAIQHLAKVWEETADARRGAKRAARPPDMRKGAQPLRGLANMSPVELDDVLKAKSLSDQQRQLVREVVQQLQQHHALASGGTSEGGGSSGGGGNTTATLIVLPDNFSIPYATACALVAAWRVFMGLSSSAHQAAMWLMMAQGPALLQALHAHGYQDVAKLLLQDFLLPMAQVRTMVLGKKVPLLHYVQRMTVLLVNYSIRHALRTVWGVVQGM